MKNSLIIVGFFIMGVLIGIFKLMPKALLQTELSTYALYILMFLVGIGIGLDKSAWKIIRKVNFKIVLVPITVIIGTAIGVSVVSIFLKDINLQQVKAADSNSHVWHPFPVLPVDFLQSFAKVPFRVA